jgi:hypothetical protein
MPLTALVCVLLSRWISFLLVAVPSRSRRTLVELLIGGMLNPEGWVTRAIGAICREAHWTTYYKLIPGDRDRVVGTSGGGDLCRALGHRALVSQPQALVGRDQSMAAVEGRTGVVAAASFDGVCLDTIAGSALVEILAVDGHRALAQGRRDHRGSLRAMDAHSIYRTSRARHLQPEVGSFRHALPWSGSAFAVLSRVAWRRSASKRWFPLFVMARHRLNSARRAVACV